MIYDAHNLLQVVVTLKSSWSMLVGRAVHITFTNWADTRAARVEKEGVQERGSSHDGLGPLHCSLKYKHSKPLKYHLNWQTDFLISPVNLANIYIIWTNKIRFFRKSPKPGKVASGSVLELLSFSILSAKHFKTVKNVPHHAKQLCLKVNTHSYSWTTV